MTENRCWRYYRRLIQTWFSFSAKRFQRKKLKILRKMERQLCWLTDLYIFAHFSLTGKWNPSIKNKNNGLDVSPRWCRPLPVLPHHRHTNVYSHTFYLLWEPRRKLIANQCCHQLTAVKTGYPRTTITWPNRGLRYRPIEVEYFFEVIRWQFTRFQMIAGSRLLLF